MKILFGVVGIGLGHATRSEAIIRQLQKVANVKVITWGPAHEYFKKVGINSHSIGGYEYKGEKYTFNVLFNIFDTFKDPGKLRREYYHFAKLGDAFKPDVVFGDSDPNTFFYAYRRNLPNYSLSNLITTIDNYDKIPKHLKGRDLVLQNFMVQRLMNYMLKRGTRIFVPSFESKVRYRDKVRYTDLIIRKKLGELPSEQKIREKLGIDEDFYLVSVGGSDIEKSLFKVLMKILPKFKDKKFIISSNFITKKVETEKNMTIYPFINNMLEYLKICKGVIAPAGHSTISEAICYKKPIMAVPVINHVEQLVNASLIQKDGFGEACFLQEKLNGTDIRKCIEKFFKSEETIRQRLNIFKFRGEGAEEIARAITTGY